MKILLAKIKTKRTSLDVIGPDIGLGYLATALCKRGYSTISIIDDLNLDYINKYIIKNKETRELIIIGIKVLSKDVPFVKGLVKEIKMKYHRIKIILGGPHPSGVREKIFDEIPDADFAFHGEGDIGLPMLVQLLENKNSVGKYSDYELSQIPGLIYRDGSDCKFNPAGFVTNLDSLGFPSWDLLNPRKYLKYSRYEGAFIPIVATRGCIFNCTYCGVHTINGFRYRKKNFANVVNEIEMLHKKYKIYEFSFSDDNLTQEKTLLENICSEILRRQLKIRWDCASNGLRFDTLNVELLQLMENAGCHYITVGIESCSDKILKHMKKEYSIEQAIRKMKDIRQSCSMVISGFFILGYPYENRDDILKTLKFSKLMNLDTAEFFLFSPHPGTPIYKQLLKNGKIIDKDIDYNDFSYDKPSLPLEDVTIAELKKFQNVAYFLFYFRFSILVKLLFMGLNPLKLKKLFYRTFFLIKDLVSIYYV